MKVSSTEIVDACLDVLNEGGLDQFSTRRVAERLGVRQPSLYARFKNKRMLLDEMNETIISRHHHSRLPRPGESWRDYLSENARSFRQAMLKYRDSALVHAGSRGTEDAFMWVEARFNALLTAGFTAETALEGLLAIWRFNLGSLLEQQSREGQATDPASGEIRAKSFPLAAWAVKAEKKMGYDAQFEAGLKFILDGMEAARKEQATPARPAKPKATKR